MSRRANPVLQVVTAAINKGQALEARDIRELRAVSKKAVMQYKSVFWVGIALFNLALWVPLPVEINQTLRYVIAFVSLPVAIVVPIVGLKKHQLYLEMLKVTREVPKRKTANDAGRAYIDQVRKQDRPFVAAELAALEGSRWPVIQERSGE